VNRGPIPGPWGSTQREPGRAAGRLPTACARPPSRPRRFDREDGAGELGIRGRQAWPQRSTPRRGSRQAGLRRAHDGSGRVAALLSGSCLWARKTCTAPPCEITRGARRDAGPRVARAVRGSERARSDHSRRARTTHRLVRIPAAVGRRHRCVADPRGTRFGPALTRALPSEIPSHRFTMSAGDETPAAREGLQQS
jgi:hypothetical protein